MVLKKSAATLEELIAQEEEIGSNIRTLEKQKKQIRVTRREFEKLTAQLPPEPKKPRRKKSAVAAASA